MTNADTQVGIVLIGLSLLSVLVVGVRVYLRERRREDRHG